MVGMVLIPLAVVFGAIAVPWALRLPADGDPLTILLAGLGFLPCLFTLFLGVLALASRSSVKHGQFNVTHARGAVRTSLVYLLDAIIIGGFNLDLVALLVSTAQDPPMTYAAEILTHMVFLCLPGIVGTLGWVSLRKTLRR